jgi:predicted acyltransferase
VLLTVASGAYDHPLKWTQLLSWNILQLIGAGYFVALAVFLLPRWAQVLFVVGVLLGKLALMTLIPWGTVDGLVATRAAEGAPLGPGTWAHFDAIKRVTNLEHLEPGWTRWIGGWLGMAQQFLPSAAIAVLGGWFAEILTAAGRSNAWKLRSAVLFGVGLVALAYLLQAGYTPAGGGLLGGATVPFSKWFFSPAFCLLAAGTAGLLLGGFYWMIDAAGWTRMTALRIYGMNAIVLYVGAEFSFKVIFSKWQITHPNGFSGNLAGGYIAWWSEWTGVPAVGAWVFVLTWLGLWWLVCRALYRRGLFVRV